MSFCNPERVGEVHQLLQRELWRPRSHHLAPGRDAGVEPSWRATTGLRGGCSAQLFWFTPMPECGEEMCPVHVQNKVFGIVRLQFVRTARQDEEPRQGTGSLLWKPVSGRPGRFPNWMVREWFWRAIHRRPMVKRDFVIPDLVGTRQSKGSAAWRRRWASMFSCAAARAYALSLLELRMSPGADMRWSVIASTGDSQV